MTKEGIMYYVYLHKRKGTNKVFYVGKGSKNRNGQRSGMTKHRNRWWHNVVNKDGGFDVEIYQDNLSEEEAYKLEKKLIAEIGLENLTNLTEGGEGGDTLTNHPYIDKIGKKISDANKGKNNPNYGKGYFYWWVQKYGKDVAEGMLKQSIEHRTPHKYKGMSGMFSTGLFGDKNPSKRPEVREKIRENKLNQKKVECPKCGHLIPETRLSLHIDKSICLKNQK
jgi:ribosomal protein S27AE